MCVHRFMHHHPPTIPSVIPMDRLAPPFKHPTRLTAAPAWHLAPTPALQRPLIDCTGLCR